MKPLITLTLLLLATSASMTAAPLTTLTKLDKPPGENFTSRAKPSGADFTAFTKTVAADAARRAALGITVIPRDDPLYAPWLAAMRDNDQDTLRKIYQIYKARKPPAAAD